MDIHHYVLNSTTEVDPYPDPEATLRQVNYEKVIFLLPVIISVVVIMVLGIIGNSLVCYIYYFRMRKSPSHYFILFLALLDLVSCCIGMPSELGDLFLPYMFKMPFACKFLRFVLSFTIISSCITLICVAFDRYYKVCKPLKGFPLRKVQILCGIAILIGSILSWPALVIYGTKTVETTLPGFYGTECSTSDKMRVTKYPLIYYATLGAAFTVTFTIFSVLYIRIGLEIRKQKHKTIGSKVPVDVRERMTRRDLTTSILSDDETSSDEAVTEETKIRANRNSFSQLRTYFVQHFRTPSDMGSECKSSNGNLTGDHMVASKRKRSTYRTIRTTYIFLAVFIAFLISFLPYLVVNVLKFTKTAFHELHSDSEELVYNFCVRSFFISNFINPIIYSLLNKNFQKECKKLFHQCRKKPVEY